MDEGAGHGRPGFASLPTELLWAVMQRVGEGVERCELVCKAWRDALQGDAFWRAIFLAHTAGLLGPRPAQVIKLIEAREKVLLLAGDGRRSAWKEALLTSRLAVPVALMGDAGHGKTTLFELLRLNLSPTQQQQHGTPAVRGVPTTDAHECVLSLPRTGQINLIDLPGDHARIKNLLAGLVGARCVLFTVSALAMQQHVPTLKVKHHMALAYTMAVKNVIVCVTQMDHPKVYYAQSVYDTAKELLVKDFARVGYRGQYHFIPISSIAGDNVLERSAMMSWYKGPTVLQALETLTLEEQGVRLSHIGRPARLIVQKVYRLSHQQDTSELLVAGCIVAGQLAVGDHVVIQPSNVGDKDDIVTVESIQVHHRPRHAVIGPHESVALKLRWRLRDCSAGSSQVRRATEQLVDMIERGSVIGPKGDNQPRRVRSFKAQVIMLDALDRYRSGYSPVVRVHGASVPCAMSLLCKIDKHTRNPTDMDPRYVNRGDIFMAELTPKRPLCLDTFSSAGIMGRLVVTDRRLLVGVGLVKEVEWDISTAHIPCRVIRPDRRALRVQQQEARRTKHAAKQNKWVGVLRNMPAKALKVTVLSAYIDSTCGWRPENCFVKLGVGANGKRPTAWHQTGTRGAKCELGFCQRFIIPSVDPYNDTLYLSVHDASRYPDDYGTKAIPLVALAWTKRGWQQTFSLDDTPYNLSNTVTLNFYLS